MDPAIIRRVHVGDSRLTLAIHGRHPRGAVVAVQADWQHIDDELDEGALAALVKARAKAATVFAAEAGLVCGEVLP